MYQPYPSAGQTPEPVRAGPPASVVMAVRLMYTGAVVSALSLIVGLATVGSVRPSLHKADPKLTANQLHNLQIAFVIGSAVFQVILIALWVWMALMNKAGKSWARIVATVLFGLNSLILLVDVTRAGGSAAALVSILTWLIGLGAVIFLWRKDASEYFTARNAAKVR